MYKIAVDSQHKLIVAENVVQDGNDSQQLSPMLAKSQEILASKNLEGLGNSGYFNAL